MDYLEMKLTEEAKKAIIERVITDARIEVDRHNPYLATHFTELGEEILAKEWSLKELKDFTLVITSLEYVATLHENRKK